MPEFNQKINTVLFWSKLEGFKKPRKMLNQLRAMPVTGSQGFWNFREPIGGCRMGPGKLKWFDR